MINPQWLELPMSRTIFYGPKDVRAIEVRLYVVILNYTNGKARKTVLTSCADAKVSVQSDQGLRCPESLDSM